MNHYLTHFFIFREKIKQVRVTKLSCHHENDSWCLLPRMGSGLTARANRTLLLSGRTCFMPSFCRIT